MPAQCAHHLILAATAATAACGSGMRPFESGLIPRLLFASHVQKKIAPMPRHTKMSPKMPPTTFVSVSIGVSLSGSGGGAGGEKGGSPGAVAFMPLAKPPGNHHQRRRRREGDRIGVFSSAQKAKPHPRPDGQSTPCGWPAGPDVACMHNSHAPSAAPRRSCASSSSASSRSQIGSPSDDKYDRTKGAGYVAECDGQYADVFSRNIGVASLLVETTGALGAAFMTILRILAK